MKNTNFLKNSLAISLIFIFTLLVSRPLFAPGLHQMHDDQQVARLFLFDKALTSGQFPVRWVDTLGFGFGYPLFVFYPPLVYMVGEIFRLMGFGFITSTKIVFFLSLFLSGITMYFFVKEIWGKKAAVVSAFFYILAPYRAIDVYIRGALAESFSFVWLPLILLAFYKLYEEPNHKRSVLASLSLALLLITHNLVFLPFIIPISIFLISLVIFSKEKIKFVYSIFGSFILAFALTAFFWIPALLEKQYTLVDDLLTQDLANYQQHFVYLTQLWNWTWGFGGSSKGIMDGISFKIGKLHILTSFAALIFFTVHLKNRSTLSQQPYRLVPIIFLLFVTSAFMSTFFSKPIWDILTPLWYLQFPWRFLTFTSLFSAILAGAFIFLLRLEVLRILFITLLLSMLLFTNLKLFKPQFQRTDLTDSKMFSNDVIKWDVSKSSFEYAPKGLAYYYQDNGSKMIDITKNQLPTSLLSNDSQSKLNLSESKPHKYVFSAETQNPTELVLNSFNFPGWQAELNGQKTAINDDNKLKLITINIPSGKSEISLEFTNTPIRKAANYTSLLTFGAFLAYLAYMIVTKRIYEK